MFNIETSRLERLQEQLKWLNKKGIPFATNATINRAAFKVRSLSVDSFEEQFILKNRFTVKSVQVDKSKGLDISQQVAAVGSTQDYLKQQEDGRTLNKKGKEGVPIPTSASAGLPEQTKPRTKLTRKSNTLNLIKIKNRRPIRGSSKRKNAAAISLAAKSSPKFVFLDFGRRKGIFRIRGTRKNPELIMLWSLKNQSVVSPAHPWLKPATDQVTQKLGLYYAESLERQVALARRRLLT